MPCLKQNWIGQIRRNHKKSKIFYFPWTFHWLEFIGNYSTILNSQRKHWSFFGQYTSVYTLIYDCLHIPHILEHLTKDFPSCLERGCYKSGIHLLYNNVKNGPIKSEKLSNNNIFINVNMSTSFISTKTLLNKPFLTKQISRPMNKD